MQKSERNAVLRIVRHMQRLQRQISKPTCDDATDEEIKTLLELLWEWTPTPNQPLPRKSTLEKLVGMMRGLDKHDYAYVSRQDVARIIRSLAEHHEDGQELLVHLGKNWREMSDTELYDNGRWNYKETPLVHLLFDLHCNPTYSDPKL